ncbi:hypothetical protein BDD12DRAFT_884889 [Trichophaea hybrida]|nr:hypothetical protein BDD12DRAFT_884889 [Trichophaea hybrida]
MAYDPLDWTDYNKMLDGSMKLFTSWAQLALTTVTTFGIAVLVITRINNLLRLSPNICQQEWMTARQLLTESESAFTSATEAMSKLKDHIERIEKELKEKPTAVQIEQWKEAVTNLATRQGELDNATKKIDKISKELQARPQAGDTEEQVQNLTTTIVELQTKVAEKSQKQQEALNRSVVGQPTIHREE